MQKQVEEKVIKPSILIPIPVNDSRQYCISLEYFDLLKEAGYRPKPIFQGMSYDFDKLKVSGLLLIGGPDIDPTFYGEQNISSWGTQPARDKFERKLLQFALEKQIPIFGICRGFQLIMRKILAEFPILKQDFHFVQHLYGHAYWCPAPGIKNKIKAYLNKDNYTDHEMIDNSTGETRIGHSSHHQAILFKEKDLRITMPFNVSFFTNFKCSKDYLVLEGIDIPEVKICATQFHVERMKEYGVKLVKEHFDKYIYDTETKA